MTGPNADRVVVAPAGRRTAGGEQGARSGVLLRPVSETIDARLAVGAVVAWLATFAALHLSIRSISYAAALAGVLGVTALVTTTRSDRSSTTGPSPRRRPGWRRGSAAVALACFCSAGTLLSLALERDRLDAGPVRDLVAHGAAGVFTVTVAGDPRAIASSTTFGTARVSVDATLTGVRSGPKRYRLRVPVVVLASADTWSGLVPGQRLSLDGRLNAAPPGAFLAGSISARGPPILTGRPPWWQRAAVGVRRDLRAAAHGLPEAERGLLPGLVDGDTSALDPQLADQFRAAGLTHLVAVSGTNAAILIGTVLLVLRRLRTPPWACGVIGGAILLAFVVVARASPSVVRAAVMAAVLLFALASGRPRQGLPSLSLAVLVLLVWHPDWADNAGFAMSALATASLFLLAPGWADALRRRHMPTGLADGLAVSAAATVVSAPIIVLVSGRVSLVALPANVLAEFAVAPATVLGVLAAATAPWSPLVGAAFAQAAGVPCRWLVADAQCFAGLPGATVSWPRSAGGALGLTVLTVVVGVLLRYPVTRRPLLAATLAAIAVEIPSRVWLGGWSPQHAILVACDVGQGDGIVLPVGPHAAVVMDSGPEPVAIDRCLHSLGVTSVPIYIQSHFDLDHVGGVAGVADGRPIGRVLTGPLQTPVLGRDILTAALSPLGITSQIVPAGTVLQTGPLRLQVLESHVVDVGGEPDSNDSSLIIRATVAGHTILLTGDASTEAQQELLDSGQDVRADVLKVPHHGSAYFDPTFLAAVAPQVAVISVGLHNTYGQPAPTLLRALTAQHVPVWRTDLDGDVAVVAGAASLRVTVHHPSAREAAAAPDRYDRPVSVVRSVAQWAARASVPASSPGGVIAPSYGQPRLSAVRVTMNTCLPPPRRRPITPRPSATRALCSSWATRNSWSAAPSSRSPPPVGTWTRMRR